MAVVDGLEVFLFEKGRDEIVVLLFSGMLHPVERVESPVPLGGVAGLARPYLVVNALDFVGNTTRGQPLTVDSKSSTTN